MILRLYMLFVLTFRFVQSILFFKKNFKPPLGNQSKILTKTQLKRAQHYYIGVTYLNTLFSLLIGRNQTSAEKIASLNLSSLASLFDDQIDKVDLSKMNLPIPIDTFARAHDPSGLMSLFLNLVMGYIEYNQKRYFEDTLDNLFYIELRSQKFGIKHPDFQTLDIRTNEKGGYSVLLFRYVYTKDVDPNEKLFWLAFGGLIQLSDDIFDLWFDHNEGIQTLATYFIYRNECDKLIETYENTRKEVEKSLMNTYYPIKNKKKCKAAIQLLTCVTSVCLDHYLALSKKYGSVPITDRALIVLDMQKIKNQLKVLYKIASPFSKHEI